MDASEIGALTFDVFGTVVDWRGSVIREGERLGADKGFQVDWAAFADDWRNDGYTDGMERVHRGDLLRDLIDKGYPTPAQRPRSLF